MIVALPGLFSHFFCDTDHVGVGVRVATSCLQEAWPEVIKLFLCSTQLSMNFSLLINTKTPTIVGIFIFISRETFSLAMFSKKDFAVVSYLRFIIMTNFMLC